jgi:hypothetical protein
MPFSSDHLAKSISRMAFLRLASDHQRQHHADERQRQRQHDRQRFEERPELHDQHEVHQHHRHADGDEHLREDLDLIFCLAALAHAVARRELHRLCDSSSDIADHFRQCPVLCVRFHRDYPVAIEMIDARRSERL